MKPNSNTTLRVEPQFNGYTKTPLQIPSDLLQWAEHRAMHMECYFSDYVVMLLEGERRKGENFVTHRHPLGVEGNGSRVSAAIPWVLLLLQTVG